MIVCISKNVYVAHKPHAFHPSRINWKYLTQELQSCPGGTNPHSRLGAKRLRQHTCTAHKHLCDIVHVIFCSSNLQIGDHSAVRGVHGSLHVQSCAIIFENTQNQRQRYVQRELTDHARIHREQQQRPAIICQERSSGHGINTWPSPARRLLRDGRQRTQSSGNKLLPTRRNGPSDNLSADPNHQ